MVCNDDVDAESAGHFDFIHPLYPTVGRHNQLNPVRARSLDKRAAHVVAIACAMRNENVYIGAKGSQKSSPKRSACNSISIVITMNEDLFSICERPLQSFARDFRILLRVGFRN